ncbi:Het-domain-containing protein [Lasiodiplodia theobromae]|uniref:Het-domain-containing protein n=1 Tax=Lasiodiplodia theobromae TaxID=45133 RepID=UPI0015C3E20F|nr:Het-domain-containing protein [Lasiodiplodia theobromae]KAF4542702.1 Het-domain-containing protein [Lasiodiplodia theobromae]
MASGFSASASVRQETTQLELSKDGTLLLQSLEVDSIASIGTAFDALENFEQVPDVFRQWMGMIGLEMMGWPEQSPQHGSQSDNFWRTMINDCSELDTSTSPFYKRADENDYRNLREMWNMLLKFQPFLGFAKLSLSDSSYESLLGKDAKAIYHLLVHVLVMKSISYSDVLSPSSFDRIKSLSLVMNIRNLAVAIRW